MVVLWLSAICATDEVSNRVREYMQKIHITSSVREEMLPIASLLQAEVYRQGWTSGILFVHCPHTTAGVTINESADPDVRIDMCGHFRELVPEKSSFRHYEGNSDAHIKSTMTGAQIFVFIEDGKLVLGQWQEVYFCEWDGPRNRSLWLRFLEG